MRARCGSSQRRSGAHRLVELAGERGVGADVGVDDLQRDDLRSCSSKASNTATSSPESTTGAEPVPAGDGAAAELLLARHETFEASRAGRPGASRWDWRRRTGECGRGPQGGQATGDLQPPHRPRPGDRRGGCDARRHGERGGEPAEVHRGAHPERRRDQRAQPEHDLRRPGGRVHRGVDRRRRAAADHQRGPGRGASPRASRPSRRSAPCTPKATPR